MAKGQDQGSLSLLLPALLFLKTSYFYLLCICKCRHVSCMYGHQVDGCQGQRRPEDSMELLVAVSHPMWVLGTELWSSGSPRNH